MSVSGAGTRGLSLWGDCPGGIGAADGPGVQLMRLHSEPALPASPDAAPGAQTPGLQGVDMVW